jgi:tRNA 2-selenouridine synthase SelU
MEPDLDRRMARLAVERGTLFDKAGASFGLTAKDQERLKAIEQELDACFLERRQQRALTDARRFDRESPFPRRTVARRASS